MKQSVIEVTRDFSEWANEICRKFAGPGIWQPNIFPMTGNELAIGLMEFVKAHRYNGTIDCLASQCHKVVKDRRERATHRKHARAMRNHELKEKRPGRERYTIATSRDFKDWLDSGRKTLVGPEVRYLTIKEYTDALMAFVEMFRYSNAGDSFGIICKKLVDGREERRDLHQIEKWHPDLGTDLEPAEIYRILGPEHFRKKRKSYPSRVSGNSES